MAESIATAYIQIVPTTEGIGSNIQSALSGECSAAGDQAGEGMGSSIVSSAIAIIGASAAAVAAAVAGVVAAANETAQYGDAIDKASQKLGISAKAYQEWDAVLQHSGTSMSSMSATFKQLANESQDASEEQVEAFAKLGMSMDDVSKMSAEDLFGAVINGLQGMEEGTERTALATTLLGRGAMELGPLLNTSAEDTQKMIDTVNELGGVMSDDAVKGAAAYQDALQDMKTAMGAISHNAMAEFLPSMSNVMNGVALLFAGDEEGLGLVKQGLNDFLNRFTDFIPQALEAAGSFILSLVQGIYEKAPELLQSGIATVDGFIDGLFEQIPTIIESAGDIINGLLDGFLDKYPDILKSGWEMIMHLAKAFYDNLPEIVAAAAKVVAKLVSTFVDHLPELVQTGVEILGKLISGIISYVPQIPGQLTKCVDSIKEAFSEYDWETLGRNIIEGIKSGISSAASLIKDAALDAAKAAFQAVKEFFGIASPSRLMRDQVGKQLAAGMAIGVEANTTMVTKAIGHMSDSALTTANYRVNSAGQATTAGIQAMQSALEKYLPTLGNMQIVMDSGELVGATVAKMDGALGNRFNYAYEGVL